MPCTHDRRCVKPCGCSPENIAASATPAFCTRTDNNSEEYGSEAHGAASGPWEGPKNDANAQALAFCEPDSTAAAAPTGFSFD